MIRVIVAEDHTIVRAGLCALLEKAGDVAVVGEAGDGHELLQIAEKLRPDVVVTDIMMPRLNGIQAAEQMREMKIPARVVLLSMYSDEPLVYQALQSGVKGYVLKSSVTADLLLAVRAAARNERYLSHAVAEILAEQSDDPSRVAARQDPFTTLAPREKEVLQLIAEEHTTAEIAAVLSISEKTVEKHRARLMEKLQARNMAGLARMAVRFGLIDRG